MENKYSQTQIANFMATAGIVAMMANQFGFVLDKSQTAFVIASLWTLGSTAYNFYQRLKKGDVSLGGKRLNR